MVSIIVCVHVDVPTYVDGYECIYLSPTNFELADALRYVLTCIKLLNAVQKWFHCKWPAHTKHHTDSPGA